MKNRTWLWLLGAIWGNVATDFLSYLWNQKWAVAGFHAFVLMVVLLFSYGCSESIGDGEE